MTADDSENMPARTSSGPRADDHSKVMATSMEAPPSEDSIGSLRIVRPTDPLPPRLSVPLFLLNVSILR
jgi:hypothetical protein